MELIRNKNVKKMNTEKIVLYEGKYKTKQNLQRITKSRHSLCVITAI